MSSLSKIRFSARSLDVTYEWKTLYGTWPWSAWLVLAKALILSKNGFTYATGSLFETANLRTSASVMSSLPELIALNSCLVHVVCLHNW